MSPQTKKIIIKAAVTLSVAAAVLVVAYLVLEWTGAIRFLSDFERVRKLILKYRKLGMAVYAALTILQVVFLPIPGVMLNLVGVALYGATVCFILTTAAVLVGSIIAFALGKLLGKRFIEWLFGKKNAKKYNKLMKGKGKYYLGLMFLLPVFPDDMLCMAAGASDMSYRFFAVLVTLTRPVMIAFTSYFGLGEIIPFSGWGIPVWILIFVFLAAAVFFVNRITNEDADGKKTTKKSEKAA